MRVILSMCSLSLVCLPLNAAGWGASAKYAHLHPKHADLQCGECHTLKNGGIEIRETPGHAACARCHNYAQETLERAEAFCGECHTSLEASKQRPALFTFPKAHLARDFGDRFSHEAHRNAGDSARCAAPGALRNSLCTDCHKPILGDDEVHKMGSKANHATCFTCHCDSPRGFARTVGSSFPASSDCAVCHTARIAAPASSQIVKNFRHSEHTLDTRPRRKSQNAVVSPADALCVECHRSAASSKHLNEIRQPEAAVCASCHTGKPGLPDPLPAGTTTQLAGVLP